CGSRLYVRASTSANTGVAPACWIALGVAINDIDGQITSSPGPMSRQSSARCKASVQLATATACVVPQYAATERSNSATLVPWVSQPERIASPAARTSSSPRKGIVIGINNLLLSL